VQIWIGKKLAYDRVLWRNFKNTISLGFIKYVRLIILLLRIREVLGANLLPETGYPE
jgi:hypothetical protein